MKKLLVGFLCSILVSLSLGQDMIQVAGGTFQMGSNDYKDEKPIHIVTVKSFYIDKYEVTVTQYRKYCSATGVSMPNKPSWGWNDNDPIVNVSWNDAVAYAKWTGKRLPTEAEWEFAARGGNKSRGYKFSGSGNIDSVAWWWIKSGKKTHIIGTKEPNELGIYDMSGNVWEWCADWYGNNYYQNSPKDDPQGPSSGIYRVLRGGSFSALDDGCRVACRYYIDSSNDDGNRGDYGFRCVKD